MRKGASWTAGTVVGSNGNSTFAAIFEQQSGTYTYWVLAYDTAGNAGTPVGICIILVGLYYVFSGRSVRSFEE